MSKLKVTGAKKLGVGKMSKKISKVDNNNMKKLKKLVRRMQFNNSVKHPEYETLREEYNANEYLNTDIWVKHLERENEKLLRRKQLNNHVKHPEYEVLKEEYDTSESFNYNVWGRHLERIKENDNK